MAGSSSNIEKEDVPKSMMRVLNAAKVREEYRQKRKRGEDTLDGDDQPRKHQKTSAGKKPRGKEDKGTLVIKVRGVNLKETASPDPDPFPDRGDPGPVQQVSRVRPSSYSDCSYLYCEGESRRPCVHQSKLRSVVGVRWAACNKSH